MTITRSKNTLRAACLSVLTLAVTTAFAQSTTKVFLTSTSPTALRIAKKELTKKPYLAITDNRDEADVVMDLKVKRILLDDKKAYAVLTDAKTGQTVHETKSVNTLTRFTFRPEHSVVKKLIRKRITPYYTSPSV
ncbi:hypothetical protein [Polluticoccus soli]|uniref:hypothetical protein n=1 Tax=Polluticoccus soli TaxID=3034150 RepID=UPI0023E0BE78|nr:hypothetical protein [Flavipsychrobacter sp. JY13-12]